MSSKLPTDSTLNPDDNPMTVEPAIAQPPAQAHKKDLLGLYSRLPLRAQIALPLILAVALLWLGGGFLLNRLFTNAFERQQQQETDAIAALIERELAIAAQNLLVDAQLLAKTNYVRENILNKDAEKLSRDLHPTQVTLALSFIKVVLPGGEVLVDLRQPALADTVLYDAVATSQVLTGTSASSRILAKGPIPSLLIGTSPVTTDSGQVIGGVIVGNPLNDALLTRIREKTQKEIVAFDNTKIIASSLPEAPKALWTSPEDGVERVFIAGQPYLAQSVLLSGLDRALLKLVVLNPLAADENTKRNLQLTITGIGGVSLVLLVVLILIITNMIERRIQRVIDAMEQVLQGNTDSRIPFHTGPPFDRLNRSFNALADKFVVQEQRVDEQINQLQQNFLDFQKKSED